jgi:diguanylate cyclase (GGDEF)-like protein/PAS domain S-box-containing protein
VVRLGGRAGVLSLAFVLAGLMVVADYEASASYLASLLGHASPQPSAPGAGLLAAASGLAALLVLLASSLLIVRETARRRRSAARLSRLLQSVDQTPTLVTIVNRKGRIEYTNKAVEATTGYGGQQLRRTSETRWLPWYADEREAAGVRDALLAGGTFRGPVSCRRKDGTPLLLEDHVTPLREGRVRAARFVSTARDITAQKRSEDRLAFLARYDPLTGLANRGHFAELLQAALARQPPAGLVVAVMDVDRFKHFNVLLAPEVGDRVLQRVAAVLRSVAGPQSIVGRLGGDEFGLACPLAAGDDALRLARSIRAALAHQSSVDALDLPITVTLGIACSPRDGSDAATLIKNADLAHTHAKLQGRDSIQVFSGELNVRARELHAMQRHLAAALRNGEYEVHYQPYCELTSGRVSGAEALIRWESEDLGEVAPARFIPVLEDSGMIVAVGEWVLRTACRQIRDWQRARRALPVAVNLSQLQLGQDDLVEIVADAIKEHAIDPRQLTLELTESLCVRDIDFAIGMLRKLKEVGVSIAVDDFGTGYSSLSHVKKLPVDSLKIDLSFVRDVTSDPDAASIITAITSMARSLGLKTIAEGVEREEQRNILRLLRCDLGQGYLFGKAVTAGTFEQLIAN